MQNKTRETYMGSYTYDPRKISEECVDRMRFELGDTIIIQGPMTSPLCDEEYIAVIESEKTWKRAKLKCLEAIMMKLSYEVNTSVDGLSYSFNDRANRWKSMYEELKKELKAPTLPTAANGSVYGEDQPHYFRKNLHVNIDKF